jgi:hypothetical protein
MAKSAAESKTMVDRARASQGSKLHKSPIGSLLTRLERAEIIAALETANRKLNLFPKK